MNRAQAGCAMAVVVCGFSAASMASAAPEVQPPFDSSYQLVRIFSDQGTGSQPIGGLPGTYASAAISADHPDTLLIAGHVYGSDDNGVPAVYTMGLARDANHHITGITGTAVLLANAPGLGCPACGIGTGLAVGPGGVLFYSVLGDNSLGMIKPGSGSADKHIDLGALAPGSGDFGPLAFVPPGFAGAGRLKVSSNIGKFFQFDVAPDGSGTFDLANTAAQGQLGGVGPDGLGNTNFTTGLGYVAAGNPQFPRQSLITANYDYNTAVSSEVLAYETDSKGTPLLATERTMIVGLDPAGATMDPVTGDMLFISYYGFELFVLQGFTVPQVPVPRFAAPSYHAAENAGSAAIVVQRSGPPGGTTTVHYATSPGTAVAGVNYTDVSGDLSWADGDRSPRTINVPLLGDSTYNQALTVNVALSALNVGVLGANATTVLSINNVDAPPVVNLTSGNVAMGEGDGDVTLSVALSHASGLPVKVPFSFSGTANKKSDYSFDLDGMGKPITAITIAPGATTGTLTLHVTSDTVPEPDVSVIATMGTPAGASRGSTVSNTITIQDDDPAPTIAFSNATSTVTETSGVTMGAMAIELSGVSRQDVSVPVNLTGGTADARINIAGTVTIVAGKTKAKAVMLTDDSVIQGTKVLTFSLGAPTHATLGTQTTHTLTVKDND